jgi:hypothetical protein
MELSWRGWSHRSAAAMSFRAEFFAPEMGMTPFRGPPP